ELVELALTGPSQAAGRKCQHGDDERDCKNENDPVLHTPSDHVKAAACIRCCPFLDWRRQSLQGSGLLIRRRRQRELQGGLTLWALGFVGAGRVVVALGAFLGHDNLRFISRNPIGRRGRWKSDADSLCFGVQFGWRLEQSTSSDCSADSPCSVSAERSSVQ